MSDAAGLGSQRASRWLLAAVGVLALVGIGAFAWMPLAGLLREFSCDDSFYFARIARELATTGRSSFDGVTETNGYQPLWTWLEVPVFWLGLDLEGSLRAIRMFEVLLAVLACGAWMSALRRSGVAIPAAAVVAFYFVRTRELYIGMEAGTSLCVLALAQWALVRRARAEPQEQGRWAWVCGIALALAPLGRLDNLAFSGAVTCALAVVAARRGCSELRLLIPLVLPQIAVVVTYALGNWLAFDTAVPVSGLVKQWWSEGTPDEGLARTGRRLGAMWGEKAARDGVVFGAVALLLVWWRGRRSAGLRAYLPCALGLFALAVAKFGYYGTTVEPELSSYSWYFTTGTATRYLAIALLVDTALRWLLPRFADGRIAVLVAALAVFGAGASQMWKYRDYVNRTEPDWEMLSYDGAQWLGENLPVDVRVASFDAGVFGYFARQPVTNLDGLVNSRSYLEDRRRGVPLTDYLQAEGIDYVINVGVTAQDLVRNGIPLGEGGFDVVHRGERSGVVDDAERRVFVLRRRD